MGQEGIPETQIGAAVPVYDLSGRSLAPLHHLLSRRRPVIFFLKYNSKFNFSGYHFTIFHQANINFFLILSDLHI